MTTELGTSDASRAQRRGLSRREMIKASAVAGAAAWTAPVIVDSLASPAAAGSVCNPLFVKITVPGGSCFCASPCCGIVASYSNKCCSGFPGGCTLPTVSGPSGGIYTVDLQGGTFSSTTGGSFPASVSNGSGINWWGCLGRYDGQCGTVAYQGTYADGGTTATLPDKISCTKYGITKYSNLSYVYLQYCTGSCGTEPTTTTRRHRR